MNRDWIGKIQLALLFICIFWNKECSHNPNAIVEEVIVMRYKKMKAKYIKQYMWNSLFL